MTLYLFTCVKLRTEVVLEVVVDLLISSEQWRRRAQLLDLFVALRDDGVDVPDNVIVKLDEVRSSDLDVGVVQILGVVVEGLEVVVLEVHHHHLLVEVLHGHAELEEAHPAVLLQVLEEGVDEVGVPEDGGQVNVQTGRLRLAVTVHKPGENIFQLSVFSGSFLKLGDIIENICGDYLMCETCKTFIQLSTLPD